MVVFTVPSARLYIRFCLWPVKRSLVRAWWLGPAVESSHGSRGVLERAAAAAAASGVYEPCMTPLSHLGMAHLECRSILHPRPHLRLSASPAASGVYRPRMTFETPCGSCDMQKQSTPSAISPAVCQLPQPPASTSHSRHPRVIAWLTLMCCSDVHFRLHPRPSSSHTHLTLT